MGRKRAIRKFILNSRPAAWLVRLVAFAINVMPEGAAMWFGRSVGRIWYCLDRRHRLVCLDNLRVAFGDEKDERELHRLAKAVYRHLGQCATEFVRFGKLNPGNIRTYLAEENLSILDEQLRLGKGVIGITGHVGLWELTGFGLACLGRPATSISRPIDSPYLNDAVDKLRTAQGLRIFHKEGALRHILKALRENRISGFLMDQYPGREGIPVPFFGRDAYTVDTAARLHLKTGAPVVVVTSYRIGKAFRHSLRVRGPLEFKLTGNKEADIAIITRACNAALEEAVREHPEQWLWLHRRWKTPGRKIQVSGEADGVREVAASTMSSPPKSQ